MDDLYPRAVALREEGWSVNDIAAELGVATSTAGRWLRHLPFDQNSDRARRRRQQGRAKVDGYWARRRQESGARRASELASVSALVGPLSERELTLVGAAIYWCEGSKAKPWRTQERIVFTNSDPGLVRLVEGLVEGMVAHGHMGVLGGSIVG